MRLLALLLLAQLNALEVAFPGRIAHGAGAIVCAQDDSASVPSAMHAQAPWDLRESILVPTIAGLQAPSLVSVSPVQKCGSGNDARPQPARIPPGGCAASHRLSHALPIGVAARGALRPYYPTAPPSRD